MMNDKKLVVPVLCGRQLDTKKKMMTRDGKMDQKDSVC